jgi:thiol-disulfide isomerase/thioredoxin
MSLRLPLVLALITVAGCDREPRAPAQPQTGAPTAATSGAFAGKIDRSHSGSVLPQATVIDPAGAQLSIESLKGKPFLLNLWATWCAPCVREMPTLDALAARQAGRLAVVTVSQDLTGNDPAQRAKIAAVLTGHHYDHLHAWLDPDTTLGFFYGGGDLPISVLYDAQGREVWRMAGAHDWTAPDSDKLLAPALDEGNH